MLMLTSCCWKNHTDTEVGIALKHNKDKVVELRKELDGNTDILIDNNKTGDDTAKIIDENNTKIGEHANSVKSMVINTPVDMYNEMIKEGLITDADAILELSTQNETLINTIAKLHQSNASLLASVKRSTKELGAVEKFMIASSKQVNQLVAEIEELNDDNAKLFKEKLYYIIIISVICLGVCVAMMFNPETTRIGKFGAITAFSICGVCLSLAYYGKEGALFASIALLIFLVYVVKGVLQSRSNNKTINETVHTVELVKKEIDAEKFREIAEKTQSDKTKKKLKVHREVVKAKIEADVAEIPEEPDIDEKE
jgi:septal ring factor EnvC (AmiA/AmiB activator)